MRCTITVRRIHPITQVAIVSEQESASRQSPTADVVNLGDLTDHRLSFRYDNAGDSLIIFLNPWKNACDPRKLIHVGDREADISESYPMDADHQSASTQKSRHTQPPSMVQTTLKNRTLLH